MLLNYQYKDLRSLKKERIVILVKRKKYTQKVEIAINKQGKIVNISKVSPGKLHDITVRRSSDKFPKRIDKYCDSGYQGLQHEASNVVLPFKKPNLTKEQKQHNRWLSKIRIYVEHKFAEIKKFRILGETYRNFGKKAQLRFNLVAGIINLQHGF